MTFQTDKFNHAQFYAHLMFLMMFSSALALVISFLGLGFTMDMNFLGLTATTSTAALGYSTLGYIIGLELIKRDAPFTDDTLDHRISDVMFVSSYGRRISGFMGITTAVAQLLAAGAMSGNRMDIVSLVKFNSFGTWLGYSYVATVIISVIVILALFIACLLPHKDD